MFDDMNEMFEEMLPEGWTTDGLGPEVLICPHGHRIEQDGECPEGCVSPLRAWGMI